MQPEARSDTGSSRTHERPSRGRDIRRWILAVSIGEALGFTVAVGAAILTILAGVDDPVRFAIIVPAGAVEGAALATGQYVGMRARRPVAWRWIAATALAAAFAWTLGLLPSTLGLDLGSPLAIAAVAIGGLVLLASIPFAQWLVLARPRAFRWVPVNMGAWAVAILWTFAPSPLVDEQSPIALVATLYVIAGLLMAVTIASLTAWVAVSLFSNGGSADR